jgi:hypothetical protein
MFTQVDWLLIDRYLEWFFFGKISVSICFNLYAKQVQFFLGLLGIYSGIFAIYLQRPLKESRTAISVFYVLCLLYVLSMTTVVFDLLGFVLEEVVSTNNSTLNIIIYADAYWCTIASGSK